jgi:glutamate--cysteine ligase
MSRLVAEDATPIQDLAQLHDYFRSGARPAGAFGVGIEYERIGLFRGSGETAPFAGRESVQTALRRLAEDGGWTPLRQEGHLVELQRQGAAVSLEPGAQLEFASSIHRDLEALRAELCGFLAEAERAAEPLGIAWVAVGLNPFTPVERIGWIPKSRYRIMSRRLGRRGRLAHHMMKATAGIQGNFDYASEEDAMRKFRLAMGVTSVTTALLANSPLYVGAANGFQSMRSFVWQDTDPDRCGLLELAFRAEEGFRPYLDYALSVPVLFVVRDGRWIDMAGYDFRRFAAEGRGEWRATMADWALHLTTLFPEVRLKRYLEVRGADSVDAGLAVALMAWWKGLLYGARALDDAWRLVSGWSWSERGQLHRDVAVEGLSARVRGRSVREIARDLTAIAEAGLREWRATARGPDETGLLEPIRIVLEDPSRQPARRLLAAWEGEWRRERARLIDSCSRIPLPC